MEANKQIEELAENVKVILVDKVNHLKDDKKKEAYPIIVMLGISEGLSIEESIEQSDEIINEITDDDLNDLLSGEMGEEK